MILSLKKSLLVIYKILRLFVNTFTTDDKYSRLNRDNLTQLIDMKLCQKKNFFRHFACGVLEIKSNFQEFEKKITS